MIYIDGAALMMKDVKWKLKHQELNMADQPSPRFVDVSPVPSMFQREFGAVDLRNFRLRLRILVFRRIRLGLGLVHFLSVKLFDNMMSKSDIFGRHGIKTSHSISLKYPSIAHS